MSVTPTENRRPRTAFVPLLCAMLAASPAAAQFPFRIGSAGQEYGKAMARDSANRFVVAALYENTIDFDPGTATANLASAGAVDTALAKYDTNGNLVWAKSIGGPGINTPHGVAIGPADSVYYVGYFGLSGGAPLSADFNPDPVATANRTNTGGWDPCAAKYDTNGNYQWAISLGATATTTSDERAWDMAVDGAGNVYFCGFFNGTFDLDASPGGTRIVTSAGEEDAYLVKYDANGTFVWGVALGGPGQDDGLSVAVDGAGNVFLEGFFSGTVDFDPSSTGTANLTSAGLTDLFVVRFDTAGNFQQAFRLGGALAEVSPPGVLRCDSANNVYMTGRFRGTVNLNPGGTYNVSNPAGTDEIFVASYTNALAFRWGFNLTSDSGLDGAHRVALDNAGSIFVSGWHSGTTDFDGGAGTFNLASNAQNGASDVFLAKYASANGAFQWAVQFGSSAVTDLAEQSMTAGLALDLAGNPCITGQYFGTVDFDPGAGTAALSNQGQNDCFVSKYTAAAVQLWTAAAAVEDWGLY